MLARSLVLLLTLTAPALAQAPRITPAGDPTVKDDTIYRLAVNPADHADDDYVYLLDDGVVRLEADGRGSRTYRQVVQIFTREAAETWGEQSFSYVSGRERLTLNWVRVVKPTGEVISARPTHEQESIAPVAQEAPVFSDVKVRRVSSGGIVPGTLLDYSYTVETLKPVMPGDFQRAWRVTTGRLTRRSRYVLDVPANLAVRVKEVNLTFPRTVVEGRGRRVYTWATADVPKIEREPFAADSNGIDQYIDVAAPVQWTDVARWYGALSRDRYAVTPALDSALASVVKHAHTLDDSLRALHRWVAQDFRYVSLSLGIGGFQPRLPGAVLATRYGDCKDKATLFIALARRLGLRAYPVLLSSTGGIVRDRPSALAFDHMIAAVQRSGGYLYLDLTSELTPFGSLPPSEQGEFGLMVHPDGSGEEVTFPSDSTAANRDVAQLTGELSPQGVFHGRYVHVAAGDQQYGSIHNYGDLKGLATELEARGPRRFPIDVAQVSGPHEEAAELTLTLPEGWRAQLPPNVTAQSAFGIYRAEYGQAGRVLHVARKLIGRKGIEPPGRSGELIQWLKDMGRDDVRYIVLEHPR